MASILSGARKYRLGLVLAHQELRQLLSKDAEVASAIITNPYTRICFRMGDEDAKKLSEGFAHFDATDLQNLSVGEAVCRIERAEYDFNLNTQPLAEIDEEQADESRAEIHARSRQKYARPRAEVEADLAHHQPPIFVPSAKEERPKSNLRQQKGQTPIHTHNFVPPPSLAEPVISSELPIQEKIVKPAAEPTPLQGTNRAEKSKTKLPSIEPAQPGKGGQQHKYLQQLIKRWGEERGYKATIEKQVAGGSVDVALEKDGYAIACEICVTTTVDHEVGNIRKCLAAGFNQIVMVTSERKALERINEAALAEIGEAQLSSAQFFLPEDFYVFLDQMKAECRSKEETFKGYKVRVKYKSINADELRARKEAIAKTVLQAIKRLKDKEY